MPRTGAFFVHEGYVTKKASFAILIAYVGG